MKALIDGDVIAYQAGFASDIREYSVGSTTFAYKKEARDWAKHMGVDPSTITKKVTAEPLPNCLHSVKKMIESISKEVDASSTHVYLSGANNFRDKLVTDYKANRDPTAKPIWHKEIKDYLRTTHSAITSDGVEADDYLGIAQTQDTLIHPTELDAETVICTIDKDLNMIAGWHYNWRNNTMFWVNQEAADRFFFHQWLIGDSSDNIHGLRGVGEKTAEKILRDISGNTFLYEAVLNEWNYRTEYEFAHVHTIGDLLWIQRELGQTWDQSLGLSTERRLNET